MRNLNNHETMQQDAAKQVQPLIEELMRLRGYRSHTANADALCKAEDIGLETFLICMETNPCECDFSVSFGDVFFCKCRLRLSIAKGLKS